MAAALYASVGHGGASAYLAAMALAGMSPGVMKPTALVLNILVSGIAAARFCRAGCFKPRLFRPFAAASIPAAFLGGLTSPGDQTYRIVVGIVLVFAAIRLFLSVRTADAAPARVPSTGVSLVAGAVIGWLSGLVGVGGGIFLSPLLLLVRWADPRSTAAVSAVFILVNSVSALAGHLASLGSLPEALPCWAAAAVLGGFAGAQYGSRYSSMALLRRLLAAALLVAAAKLIFQ
ncbi:MAG: sulfite exporter TauE/SafE family protein [bacterium]